MSSTPYRSPAALGLVALGAAVAVDGLLVEPRRVTATPYTVALRGLPAALDGLTIAHLSDLHVGARYMRPEAVMRAVEIANRAHPDVIVLTGDYADSPTGALRCAGYLAALRAPHGVVAVLGNHDYYGGPRRPGLVVRALENAGIRVLRNAAHRVEHGGAGLWLVGLDDARLRRDNIALALRDVMPGDGPRVLLAHYPDVAATLAPGQVDLVLSGHTHGGQINLPVVGRAAIRRKARSRYGAGRYDVNGTPLIISRGIATIGVPARLRCLPDVPIVRLVARS